MGKNYASYSYWLETCGDDLTPRPALSGTVDVDVAILGAGFTGLWTAYYLLQREPALTVAILESEIAGFGASGRNGGTVGNRFPVGLRRVAQLFGRQAAIDLQRAIGTVVDEIAAVAAREGIEMDYVHGGYIRLARSPYQLDLLHREQRTLEEFGFGDDSAVLDADQVAERVAVAGALGGHHQRNGAKIHPAKLARGLARAVERRGATIYEQSPVTGWTTGAYPALHTARGHARAKTIVLAGESYLSRFPELRRKVLPVYSLIIATEPLSPATWDEIGLARRETFTDHRHLIVYGQRTADDRMIFGGRGAPYHLGSRIRPEYDRDEAVFARLYATLVDLFPVLAGTRVTHAWGGALGIARDWWASVGLDRETGLAWAGGYVGDGVSTTNLAGRTLRDLVLGRDTDLTRLPWVGHRSPDWEREPWRWLGINAGLRAMTLADAEESVTRLPSVVARVVSPLLH